MQKKKGTNCRFNFPRPPSGRTFISRRKIDKDADTCGEPSMKKDLAEVIMKKVKTALLNNDSNVESVDTFFFFFCFTWIKSSNV